MNPDQIAYIRVLGPFLFAITATKVRQQVWDSRLLSEMAGKVFNHCLKCMKQGGFNSRGEGTLFFSSYVGSGPASTIHPKKYQEIQASQKIS